MPIKTNIVLHSAAHGRWRNDPLRRPVHFEDLANAGFERLEMVAMLGVSGGDGNADSQPVPPPFQAGGTHQGEQFLRQIGQFQARAVADFDAEPGSIPARQNVKRTEVAVQRSRDHL